MLLSNTQRYMLIGITAIIAVMLYAQIDGVGLKDSQWMIGLVIIATLLLSAFAPRKEWGSSNLSIGDPLG